jgi:hypothetical protein
MQHVAACKTVEVFLHAATCLSAFNYLEICIIYVPGVLNMKYPKSQINYLRSQLIVSLLYTNHTTCFGYTAILRCIMYIKMLKLLLKHNRSVNLLSKLTIIQVLYIHDTPQDVCISETCSAICVQ